MTPLNLSHIISKQKHNINTSPHYFHSNLDERRVERLLYTSTQSLQPPRPFQRRGLCPLPECTGAEGAVRQLRDERDETERKKLSMNIIFNIVKWLKRARNWVHHLLKTIPILSSRGSVDYICDYRIIYLLCEALEKLLHVWGEVFVQTAVRPQHAPDHLQSYSVKLRQLVEEQSIDRPKRRGGERGDSHWNLAPLQKPGQNNVQPFHYMCSTSLFPEGALMWPEMIHRTRQ